MEWRGKKAIFLGDSITEGVGVRDPERNRYDRVLQRIAGLREIVNYGISGTKIARQKDEPGRDFCTREAGMMRDADLVIVFGGTNDYGWGSAPFGSVADVTPDTFCGAVNYLMDHLRKDYPDAVIVFMTPTRRGLDENVSNDVHKTPDSLPLVGYADYILKAGKKRGIPVLDLYRELDDVNPAVDQQREMYMPDTLHPCDLGHYLIALKLWEFLQTL